MGSSDDTIASVPSVEDAYDHVINNLLRASDKSHPIRLVLALAGHDEGHIYDLVGNSEEFYRTLTYIDPEATTKAQKQPKPLEAYHVSILLILRRFAHHLFVQVGDLPTSADWLAVTVRDFDKFRISTDAFIHCDRPYGKEYFCCKTKEYCSYRLSENH